MRYSSTLARAFIVSGVLTCIVNPVQARTPHGDTVSTGSITRDIQIENFGAVGPTYYRGAQPQGDDYAALAALGVKTVIDLQADGLVNEEHFVKDAGMNYHRIAMTTRVAPTEAQIAEFLQIVNDPASQPVYVHCAGGHHRTGVMTAIYRMTADHWTASQAFKEMKQYGFGADFLHPEFKKFVYAFRAPSDAPGASAVTTRAAN